MKCGTLGAKIITVPQQFEVTFCPMHLPLLANNTAEEQDTEKGIDKNTENTALTKTAWFTRDPVSSLSKDDKRSTSKVCLDCGCNRVAVNDSGKYCKLHQFPLRTPQTSTHQISDMSCRDEHISYGAFSMSQTYCTPQLVIS